MLVEIPFVVLVLLVALLIAVDVTKTPTESAHVQAERRPYETEREIIGAPRDAGGRVLPGEPAGTGITAPAHDSGPRRFDGISPSAGGHRRPGTSSAAQHKGPRGGLKNWPARSRLFLLVITSVVAATVVTLSVVRITDSLQSASMHSRISSVRDGAIVSALVAGVILVVVLALAVWLAIIVARSVLQPLHRLQAGTLEVAEVRLPDTVRLISERNGQGVPLDVKRVDVDTSDEIGDVARAFDQVHREALRLATDEAAIRGKLNAILINLSRRNQSIAERQIRLIDGLEQGEQHPERLTSLFRLDHLTTRMRRYSQNLLVLAGQQQSDHSDQPVALVNVIRAAISEIEEYERASMNVQPGITVSGPAVNDLVHVLAELTENATSLSSADTPVVITGRRLASGGILVDIVDRGFGMSAQEMAHANWRLDNPPVVDVTASKNMGLFVVGRLAARHGIRVRLAPSDSGGLQALVWLPDALIMHEDTAAPPRLGGYGNASSRPDSPESLRVGRLGQMHPDRAVVE
jgi:signal transduction histidine kinase